ncbi:MAG: HNH endonuclease [Lachnospiraceae bacterium]|nr:HNH endonuclease [Lachnospiraceae bacterium]
MFHPYKKDSSHLRTALFSSYKEKCAYCGRTIQQRDMHIDHVVPSNMGQCHDDEIKQYLFELGNSGFILDSIENYLPSCPACNLSKSNRIFNSANLRFYHETARAHVDEVLQIISKLRDTQEFFYSPIDTDTWEPVDFSYQRSISHAIMGYRLTPADVKACPRFPQVEKIVEQLTLVDYVVVQGKTGCGKSISMYQAAYDLYQKDWKVYRLKVVKNQSIPVIPLNSEPSLYIIDDAQQLSDKTIDAITAQARPFTKILLAKTISSSLQYDLILLTNRDAVKILYGDFITRPCLKKDGAWLKATK